MIRQQGIVVPGRRSAANGAEARGPAHSDVLASLRKAMRPYVSGPLPEWETFAAATAYFAVESKSTVACTDRDVFLLVRGIVKLMRRTESGEPGRIYEFFEAPTVVAPRTKPRWASHVPPLLSQSRWTQDRWGASNADIVAVERSYLLRMDFRVIEQLMARHAAWGEAVHAMMWTYVEGLFASATFTSERDVEARLRFMKEHRAALMRKVSQREIASYLDITESALSRVVRRLREREAHAPEG